MSPTMIETLEFLDEVDELCDLLPSYHSEQAARVRERAAMICKRLHFVDKESRHDTKA